MRAAPKPVVPNAPAAHADRQRYINSLVTLFREKRPQWSAKQVADHSVVLEHSIASSCRQRGEYLAQIKRALFNVKKYGNEKGLAEPQTQQTQVAGSLKGKYGTVYSSDHVIAHLKSLCISSERLQRHGYVVEAPAALDLPTRVPCGHCKHDFELAHIRAETKCTFHYGKILTSTYENLKLGKKIYGTQYADRTYSCCKQPVGQSDGCRSLKHHVFKLQSAAHLQKVKAFKTIAQLRRQFNISMDSNVQKKRADKIKAIGLDCEMCYTNLGFEMMKISVSDFLTEKPLLNSIVHPDGDLIIDLNSHVSGVDSIPPSAMTFDELLVKLAELTDENTIIIGHGLENDLNVLRLIHPLIVDTAILLSENQVQVNRKDPLKKIAWQYLSENIQADSHDSLEDAVIPIRIIKKFITQRLDRAKLAQG